MIMILFSAMLRPEQVDYNYVWVPIVIDRFLKMGLAIQSIQTTQFIGKDI